MGIENFKNLDTLPIKVKAGEAITAEVDSVLLSSGLTQALAQALREQIKYAAEMLRVIEEAFLRLDLKKHDPKSLFLGIGALRTERAMYETRLEQLGVARIEKMFKEQTRAAA